MTTTHPHSRSPGDALTPHARGLHPWPARRHQVHGIIPAHAGFTPSTTGAATGWSDHPRTRGVYFPMPRHKARRRGSSPHTRGLLRGLPASAHDNGIIPAHAGFTILSWIAGGGLRDHPRTRGVYTGIFGVKPPVTGSSPHTRGLHLSSSANPFVGRIIPAHAGFTPPKYWNGYTSEDHPRTRGVYRRALLMTALTVGSSPHTRGLRGAVASILSKRRIIPAHAGFTPSARISMS